MARSLEINKQILFLCVSVQMQIYVAGSLHYKKFVPVLARNCLFSIIVSESLEN